MKVAIYARRGADVEQIGNLFLTEQGVVADQPDDASLKTVMLMRLPDPVTRQFLTAQNSPRLWLENLHRFCRGTYLNAGRAEKTDPPNPILVAAALQKKQDAALSTSEPPARVQKPKPVTRPPKRKKNWKIRRKGH